MDNLVEIPVYVSPIAVAYNLPGVDALQLSPDTLAKIMNHDITKWNDPAIAADNPGVDAAGHRHHHGQPLGQVGHHRELPAVPRGRRAVGLDLRAADTWPVKGGESAQGTSGVVDAISAGDGTIGYADASQVGDLGMAALKVGASFVRARPPRRAAKSSTSRRGSTDPGHQRLHLRPEARHGERRASTRTC